MTKVILKREISVPPFPRGWMLIRPGTGPGRSEGMGFKTRKEAKTWANKQNLEIVKEEK